MATFNRFGIWCVMVRAKKFIMIMLWVILGILLLWWLLTLFVQQKGPYFNHSFGNIEWTSRALIVYDGDPIYNLDERVCTSFAKGLVVNGMGAQVVSVQALQDVSHERFDLLVFCANTYNWAPDRAVTKVIKQMDIEGRRVVAIVVGSGSTKRAKRLFEETIIEEGGQLLSTETYWLLRPNDESRLQESNVLVAEEMAFEAASNIAKSLNLVQN